MEKILRIEDGTFSHKTDYTWSDSFDGLIITTDKQTIKIGISNGQSCCESWGNFSTNDNVQDFVDAEITGIKLTDTSLNTKLMTEKFEYGFDEGDIQFVDIETSKGTLQYAVYNSHNGYYGHSIIVESEQLKHESSL